MSVTRKTRKAQREQDRRDAVGAEPRLGPVALADAGARGVVLTSIERGASPLAVMSVILFPVLSHDLERDDVERAA